MMWIICLFLLFLHVDGADIKSQFVDPAWHEIITAGGMHLGSGRTKRFVQMNSNQPNVPYQACIVPGGATGHCRHLHHCIQDEFKRDFTKFLDVLCIIQRTSIGVCCPDTIVFPDSSAQTLTGRIGALSLTGDLPATAPLEEENEALLKIVRAENRGCGVSTRAHTKMIGAVEANPREWPWMASITPEGFQQYCGGVLITDRHVLTAAHCTRRWRAEDLYVRLGEYDFARDDDTRSYNFHVVEKRQHPDFQHSNYLNDIAILKLNRPAVFNTYIWPICLPPIGLDLVNQTAYIIGWGTQFYGGPNSKVLLEVGIPIWDQQKCVASFTDSIFDENLCAGAYEGGRDACQGDSGGPLMYEMSSGRWVVIGVVSWGIRCGEPNHPGVYTKVDRYLQWIVENSQF